MITLVGLDPGNIESAYVAMQHRTIIRSRKAANDNVLADLDFMRVEGDRETVLAIEMISSYGMPVGHEIFDTCVWIGRFVERWRGRHAFVKRGEVKLAICGTPHAKDPNIRAALIERHGGKVKAIGRKGSEGPLHGITADMWSALAVATTYLDRAEVGSGKGLLR